MRSDLSTAEPYRLRGTGPYSTDTGMPYGSFYVPFRTVTLVILADDGATSGWEHVSVSLPNRCPNWEEMCHVKALFWNDEESVMQFHPRRSEYVNNHPHCLHMWRERGLEPELPPREFV